MKMFLDQQLKYETKYKLERATGQTKPKPPKDDTTIETQKSEYVHETVYQDIDRFRHKITKLYTVEKFQGVDSFFNCIDAILKSTDSRDTTFKYINDHDKIVSYDNRPADEYIFKKYTEMSKKELHIYNDNIKTIYYRGYTQEGCMPGAEIIRLHKSDDGNFSIMSPCKNFDSSYISQKRIDFASTIEETEYINKDDYLGEEGINYMKKCKHYAEVGRHIIFNDFSETLKYEESGLSLNMSYHFFYRYMLRNKSDSLMTTQTITDLIHNQVVHFYRGLQKNNNMLRSKPDLINDVEIHIEQLKNLLDDIYNYKHYTIKYDYEINGIRTK